jgi:hypothetical protein
MGCKFSMKDLHVSLKLSFAVDERKVSREGSLTVRALYLFFTSLGRLIITRLRTH